MDYTRWKSEVFRLRSGPTETVCDEVRRVIENANVEVWSREYR